ncbi:MAG: DedA family protein [Proteobacteria bacterium]|nr:DedA family protein [Pseudomonadota bacterium]
MDVSQLISDNGYLAIFVTTFFEGETIQIFAGWAAHKGLLSFPLVVLAGFTGTLVGDQLYYWLGRRFGRPLMHRFPWLEQRSEPALGMLRRYDNWFILGFRFVYGVRNIAPFACGVAGIGVLRYTVLNTVAAAIWATSFCTVGYFFGKAIGRMVEHYGMTVVLPSVVAIIALSCVAHRLRHWLAPRRQALSEAAAVTATATLPPTPATLPIKAD